MKNTLLLILLITSIVFSCATPELCNSYTDYYSQKLKKNDYYRGSKVDRKRKKLFKKYSENSKKPDSSLIMIERISQNAELNGYSINFIKDYKTLKVIYYKVNKNKVIYDESLGFNKFPKSHIQHPTLALFVKDNGIIYNLVKLKNNDEIMLGKDFGVTILTEFDENLKVKASSSFDNVITLDF